MGIEFSEAVNTAKQERIGNLMQLSDTMEGGGLPSLSKKSITEYFSGISVNRESIKNFLLSTSDDYVTIIEGQLTNIDSGGEGYDQILGEIENMGPFSSPEDLIKAIAEQMKHHMSYNTFIALEQVLGTDIDVSQNLDDPEASFTSYHISVIESVFGCFREEGAFLEAELPYNYRVMIESLLSMGTPQELTQYVRHMSSEDVILFKEMISIISVELRNNRIGNSDSVTNILTERKVGVCRHFSAIAKKIYNDIVNHSDSIKFNGESEVIYVINTPISHVYNILMYEGQEGNIRKVYFDITDFLSNGTLFPTSEDMQRRKSENEIYVEQDTSGKSKPV